MFIIVKPALNTWIFYAVLLGYVTAWWFVFKKLKHKLSFFLFFILLFGSVWFTLHLPSVQTWLVKQVTNNLSKKLKTKLSIRHIDFHFFDKLDLKGLYVEDLHKDTLLYAGTATIKITDWFFLQDNVTLHYVALEDAQINLKRSKDTIWNHQFLIDYFSGPKKAKDTTSGGINLKLEELQLKNISLRQIDAWKGKDQSISLKSLDLVTDTFDLKKEIISIGKLNIDGPQYTQRDYEGERDRLGIVPRAKQKDTAQKQDGGLVISVKHLRITNGTVGVEAETNRGRYTDRFDGNYIRFTDITADMKNVRFANDTLTTDITLSTKEQSGFEVKKLQAKMKFTPEIMEFKELDLVTNKSRLGNYYSMRYEDFNDDMGHFLHKIKVQGNFVNSELNTDDLSFFAPELKTWKRIFNFSGNARGTIDNLVANKMFIKSGSTFVNGDISMKGLPEIDSTFIDFTARDLQTNYSELTLLVPSLKQIDQPKLSRLGNISFKGNFTGTFYDFVTFGTINTNLGTVTGDLNLKLPGGKPSVYSGQLSTQNFKLGQFLDDNKVGSITFNGNVNGSGLTSKTLDAKFNGNVRSVEYDGYNYQNITLNGSFKKKLFNGLASINDPNLKIDNLTGTIDFNGKEPDFRFDASLVNADFKKLGFTKEEFTLKGHFNFNFTGGDIDNFLGEATVKDASLLHNGTPMSFDSLVLISKIDSGQKYLSLQSNEVDANITGKFNILDLPGSFQTFLNRYYPAYIKKPSEQVSDQDFSFEIKTKTIDEYVKLADKRLEGFNNSTISGNLKLKNNELNIHADIPEFSYDKKKFNNVLIDGKGNFDSLATKITAEDVVISDSLHLPLVNLSFTSANDVSDVSLKTSASKTISEASVNAQVTTLNNGVKVHFFPSSFIINDNKWQLEKDGEITIGKSLVSASNVKFVNGNQEIKISTEPSETGSSNDVVVELSKVHVDDITNFVIKDPQFQGQISGTIKIEDPFGKQFIHSDAYIDSLIVNNDTIGLFKLDGTTYNASTGILTIKGKANNEKNKLDIDGTVNLNRDSTGIKTSLALKSEKFDLSILNSFLDDLFTDIKGTANTNDLTVTSDGKNTEITGTANITEGSLLVNYTQCRYNFKNESIIFNPNEIDFGSIELKDTLNNTATLSGKMYHHFFKDIEFDNINLASNKLLVLNTTRKDNAQFYGKVIGKASMTLSGNEENILMNITGEPSTRDSSHVYIVSGNSIEKETLDYIDFVQFGTAMEERYKSKSAANVLVRMDLVANPSCKVDVILDEATGDVIKGTGNGRLKINVGNKEDLTINGRYDITEGEYSFNFQTFLKKYFTVKNGSSIIWNGDPYKANINITAEYVAKNVDFGSLSSNSGVSGGSSSSFNQKSDLRVVANLTNTLLEPKITFELQLPPGTPITDFLVLKKLEQFKQDENELNKQITSLLLFNQFISTNQNFLSASGGVNALSSTIGGVVSGVVSGVLNTLIQKIPGLSIDVDLNTSLGKDLQTNVEKLQAAAKGKLVYRLLNGRLIISAGINVDYNNPYANSNTSVLVTPDVTIEWVLTKNGRVRVVGFNRTNYDLIGQRNRTGLSLAYRRDFNKIWKFVANVMFFEWASKRKLFSKG